MISQCTLLQYTSKRQIDLGYIAIGNKPVTYFQSFCYIVEHKTKMLKPFCHQFYKVCSKCDVSTRNMLCLISMVPNFMWRPFWKGKEPLACSNDPFLVWCHPHRCATVWFTLLQTGRMSLALSIQPEGECCSVVCRLLLSLRHTRSKEFLPLCHIDHGQGNYNTTAQSVMSLTSLKTGSCCLLELLFHALSVTNIYSILVFYLVTGKGGNHTDLKTIHIS